jgi:hypothetical protein
MPTIRFDWRWIAAILVVALLANSRALPWPVVAGALALGGGYLLYLGWGVASGLGGMRGPAATRRVTYWRGQRIETQAPPRQIRMPSLRELGPAALYLVVGGVMVLAAIGVAARALQL